MTIKIVGSRNLNFKNDNGDVVKGTQYAYLFEDSRVNGYWFDKFFIGEGRSVGTDILVGHDYDVSCYFRSSRLDLSTLVLIK